MHQRNTDGLKAFAKQKQEKAIDRAEEGIKQLIKAGRAVNFEAVAEIAEVSRAWLYKQPELRSRIEYLRNQGQQPRRKTVPMKQRASDASNLAVIKNLKEKIQNLQAENQKLRTHLEVVHGHLLIAQQEAESYKKQIERSQGSQDKPIASDVQCPMDLIERDELLQELNVVMNSTLRKLFASTPQGIIDTAIKALQQAQLGGQVKNPSGFLYKALTDQWKPSETHEKQVEADGFSKWWKYAHTQGIVIAATTIDSSRHVCTSDGQWVPLHKMMEKYPIPQAAY